MTAKATVSQISCPTLSPEEVQEVKIVWCNLVVGENAAQHLSRDLQRRSVVIQSKETCDHRINELPNRLKKT